MNRLPVQDAIAVCERIGIYKSSCSIYGGLPGVFDYGPLGAEIKIHLRKAWWQAIVYDRDDVHGIEAALLTSPLLHKYSGFLGANYEEFGVFETHIKDSDKCLSPCHLRVTTAQHSFANFDSVKEWTQASLPFGIAQIGKAFRNEQEVTDFPVRMREFEQMELQYFIPTRDARQWHDYWLTQRLDWWQQQGINLNNLMVEDVPREELAHYSSKTYDIYYKQQNESFFEIEGIADRGDFDCGSHSGYQNIIDIQSSVLPNNVSTALMAVRDPTTNSLFAPSAIEPAAGVDRGLMAILLDSYVRIHSSDSTSRIVLRIKPHLAPIKACLYIENPNDLQSIENATVIKRKLQQISVGKVSINIGDEKQKLIKYHDEIGTPIFISLDEMFTHGIITIRNRDTALIEKTTIDQFYQTFKSIYRS
ncbi:aminoacyl--tRNA ligase-related protein [Pseudomonas sp. SDO55104_S430]